jgi:hypothetical protein
VLARALFGDDIDRRVLPIVAVSFTYAASFSTFWVYVAKAPKSYQRRP